MRQPASIVWVHERSVGAGDMSEFQSSDNFIVVVEEPVSCLPVLASSVLIRTAALPRPADAKESGRWPARWR
jgi:hypothetical protein